VFKGSDLSHCSCDLIGSHFKVRRIPEENLAQAPVHLWFAHYKIMRRELAHLRSNPRTVPWHTLFLGASPPFNSWDSSSVRLCLEGNTAINPLLSQGMSFPIYAMPKESFDLPSAINCLSILLTTWHQSEAA